MTTNRSVGPARWLTIAAFLVPFVGLPSHSAAQRTPAIARAPEALPGPGTTWSLAAVGDAIITRRVAPFDNTADPRFQQMVKVIRGADAAMVNLELSTFRFSEFRGWPEVENGGNWEVAPPEVAEDLKLLGFDLFNRANNHTTDYGVEGMRLTNRLLDRLGVVHAGSGENLGAASRPGYLETPKGRIAFIGLATSFTPMSRAGDARPDMVGRPGLNALRVERAYEADPATFEQLRAAAAGLAGSAAPTGEAAQVRLLTQTVRKGAQTRTITTVNQIDEARILREIRNASSLADYVVVTSHSHESTVVPPAWLTEWARKCLDAGATTYIIQGPHLLRGIEIYKGKPIFYSLANFVFQNETIDPMPEDHYEVFGLADTALASNLYDARFRNGTTGFPSNAEYYESVVALPTFRGSSLVELRLYPIELSHRAPRSQRGTPRLADETTGRKIIERLAQMSAPLGTTIVYQDGVGVWRPNP
ncbi:MAG TPA: CapA family protein [Gemmatimonadaceae bacterium]|jgi:poly-gamma-glutamate synthesis protein (capsule biosynthesis protein)